MVENKIVLIAQIEHVEAVNNLEEILSFDEIDGIIIDLMTFLRLWDFLGNIIKKR